MTKLNKLKELDGTETWTNAFGKRFGERICVGVEYPNCMHAGEKFKPTSKEIKELWDDHVEQELGTPEQIKRDLEEEFGKGKVKYKGTVPGISFDTDQYEIDMGQVETTPEQRERYRKAENGVIKMSKDPDEMTPEEYGKELDKFTDGIAKAIKEKQ